MKIKNKNIFLIGGGELKDGETKFIDEIFANAAKNKDTLLFIPNASNDNEDYIKTIKNYFNKFKKIEILFLSDSEPISKEKIKNASAIYIGGGNTDILLNNFINKNLKETLITAIKNNTPVAAISAGAQLLSKNYIDIENNFKKEEDLPYIGKGLGVVNINILCHATKDTKDKAYFLHKKHKIKSKFVALGNLSAINKNLEKFGKGSMWKK